MTCRKHEIKTGMEKTKYNIYREKGMQWLTVNEMVNLFNLDYLLDWNFKHFEMSFSNGKVICYFLLHH